MANEGDQRRWRIWLDRGGTFTDGVGISPAGGLRLAKVLSSPSAPLEAIRRMLGLGPGEPIPACDIRMGTTLATNALLERRGSAHALVITAGFADSLGIGTQQRPDLFSLAIAKPPALYAAVVEARERLAADGAVLAALDLGRLETDLRALRARGLTALAVVFLHGHAFPAHERAAAELARALGFAVSCSHEVNPEIGLTARGDTTTVDAYLTPLLRAYVEELLAQLPGSDLRLMQSNGGLADPERFRGHQAILSGPAGGVVACARLAARNHIAKAVGFDMGGTSTDVSRYEAGADGLDRVYASETAGLRIRAPSLDIHTVAAGGGSLCRLRAGRLTVGPESAGADPGPLCYGLRDAQGAFKAGELTVTDVNLYLGRLQPENFPFPLRLDRVRTRVEALRAELRGEGQDLSGEDIARGFLEVVNRQMAQAIKDICLAQGRDAAEYALLCFGGAGGQHACAVARLLGMRRILLHPLAGVLSALGMGLAETRWEGSSPLQRLPLRTASPADLAPVWTDLQARGREQLRVQGFAGTVEFRRRLDLRYRGSEYPLSVSVAAEGAEAADDWLRAFAALHQSHYGYQRPGHGVEMLQARVEAVGPAETPWPVSAPPRSAAPRPGSARMALPGGMAEVPVYRREDLPAGFSVAGPALVLESIATVVVDEGFRAAMDEEGQLVLEAIADARPSESNLGAPALLELFHHAFMSIASRMGQVLQRTALSTNIKERLDFSCAVFDAEGALVANAPHIPVHLGAMGESVRHVRAAWPAPVPGDVFATNDPHRGGSHLPDITVVTPVFLPGEARPAFFTASRAHHAEVGGITPGSMPAFSTRLDEEGVLLEAVKLVDAGRFDAERCRALFASGPFPSRNPDDNRADLEAQTAANRAGSLLLAGLVAEHGWERVRMQMGRLRANAARQVREALGRLPPGSHAFADALDDGTAIRVRIDIREGGAVVDFTGSGPESPGNLNAPAAVVRSAVMYALRCLVAERIPLNEGCLDPVRIVLPEKSILNPSPGRAVVGGNVETSQRVVDVLLGALGLAAASQGTMNNISFGDGTFGYYETLGGGAGAGPGFAGASAVHTHMTNTRITDPEVLETRYPVRLERFEIRRGSGGTGQWCGGDGLIRQFRFLKPVEVSLLTQRRALSPFGLQGGEAGARGKNLRITAAGEREELPGATSYAAGAEEGLIIETPGGGAWGACNG